MRVRNMVSASGNPVANQFIVEDNGDVYFQSYQSIIVLITRVGNTYIDPEYWDYSPTTGKYRNLFLNETKKETEAKLKSGEYEFRDLN